MCRDVPLLRKKGSSNCRAGVGISKVCPSRAHLTGCCWPWMFMKPQSYCCEISVWNQNCPGLIVWGSMHNPPRDPHHALPSLGIWDGWSVQLAEQPQHRTVGGITWERCRPSVPTAVVGFLLPSLLPYGCFLAQTLFSALRRRKLGLPFFLTPLWRTEDFFYLNFLHSTLAVSPSSENKCHPIHG